jgi:hypothetical protein
MICPLHFGRPGAKYPSCGSASALPPPSLGVSSLDLGRWRASGLFFVLGHGAPYPGTAGVSPALFLLPPARSDGKGKRAGRPRSQGREGCRKPCGTRIAAAVIWLLSFVQCGGICCGAATPSLPLPVVGVSSLDLGRWRCWWPFFFVSLFRSRPIGMQFL